MPHTLPQKNKGPRVASFAHRVVIWQQQHGRHSLPWQGADAYRVWLSEVMLQQTQVKTATPYYLRFVARFPTIRALASSSEEDVLTHWSGLGYYSRARNLHRAAQQIMQRHKGVFPSSFEDMVALPGVGRSTAGAISAFAFHERRAILDGNVKRVLARHYAIEGHAGDKKAEGLLWERAEELLPRHRVAIYTQGLIDLGALVCKRSRPQCPACPLQASCVAHQNQWVARLPTPRPRKALPERHATLVLLLNGSKILLERRHGGGIWGGLWCPPQIDSLLPGEVGNLVAHCLGHLNVVATHELSLPTFTHTFTHFRLHITPVILRAARAQKSIKSNGAQGSSVAWLDIDAALHAAIPTPVQKLLQWLQARVT